MYNFTSIFIFSRRDVDGHHHLKTNRNQSYSCFSSLAMASTKQVYLRRKKHKMCTIMIEGAPNCPGVSLWCYVYAYAHHPCNRKKRRRSSEAVVASAVAMLGRMTTWIRNLLDLAEPGYTRTASASATHVPSRCLFAPSPKASRRWQRTSSGRRLPRCLLQRHAPLAVLVNNLCRRRSGIGNHPC